MVTPVNASCGLFVGASPIFTCPEKIRDHVVDHVLRGHGQARLVHESRGARHSDRRIRPGVCRLVEEGQLGHRAGYDVERVGAGGDRVGKSVGARLEDEAGAPTTG